MAYQGHPAYYPHSAYTSGAHSENTYVDDQSLPLTFPEYESYGVSSSTFSAPLQFQIPNFLTGGPPTLPPGGGAEAISGMLPQPGSSISPGVSWFVSDFINYSSPSTSGSGSHSEPRELVMEPADANPEPPQPFLPVAAAAKEQTQEQDVASADAETPTSTVSAISIPPNIQPLLYSVSGFNVLSVLGKVANRSRPKINLGPVDFTCSFCFVDVRRHDGPIVYASPSFYELTGYSEKEVLGKNCRFLQHPDGKLDRGADREYTSLDAVQTLRKSLLANKECQVSLLNYRKGGKPFVNLVTVIPVPGDDDPDEIAYHVGFQIDLTQQPNAILERLNNGSYASTSFPGSTVLSRRKAKSCSKELSSFLKLGGASSPDGKEGQRSRLNSFLLDNTSDFMHVLSLKGLFQYASPSVRNVLGYEAEELVGRPISDICHPADLMPLIRDLKESSVAPPVTTESLLSPTSNMKIIRLLYRAETKSGAYVWVEAHGRLHVETGKGRKSIILCGRLRSFPSLTWPAIDAAGGLSDREFWALLSPHGHWLSVSEKVEQLLKRTEQELRGKLILDMMPMPIHQTQVLMTLKQVASSRNASSSAIRVHVELQGKENRFYTQLVFYTQASSNFLASEGTVVVCQVKVGDMVTLMNAPFASTSTQMGFSPIIMSTAPPTLTSEQSRNDVFQELHMTNHTSWQYELTSLKMANEDLMGEISELEATLGLLPSIRSLNLVNAVSQSTTTSRSRGRKRKRTESQEE